MPGDSKVLTEQDKRLREVETKLASFEQRVEQLLQAVEEIKEAVRDMAGSAASRDSLNKLESAITTAHTRLDAFNKEFWKLQTEHVTYQKSNDVMANSLAANNKILAELQSSIRLLEQTVCDVTKAKDRTEEFWTSRAGSALDKVIQFLPWIATMAYLHFKLNS